MARLVEVSDAKWTKTRVHCSASYGGEEEPRSFEVGHQHFGVLEVVARGESWEMTPLNLRR